MGVTARAEKRRGIRVNDTTFIQPPPPWRPATRRAGFSFTEVLFAIMILGIGFIMVAAIFPAALTQTRNTGQEANAAVMARGAFNYIEKSFLQPSNTPTPLIVPVTVAKSIQAPTTVVYPYVERGRAMTFRDVRVLKTTDNNLAQLTDPEAAALWESVRGNLVLPSDPRLAWVPIFRRDSVMVSAGNRQASPYVQVILIAAQVQGRTLYDLIKDTRRGQNDSMGPANLEPTPLVLTLTNGKNGAPDTVSFVDAVYVGRAAPGAFLVISDDPKGLVPPNGEPGAFNGRVFRLGNPVEGATNTYELAPGADIPPNEPSLPEDSSRLMLGLVLGRAYVDPDDQNQGQGRPQYDGNVQDVSVYTTFVRAP
jgi:hypothetical protein